MCFMPHLRLLLTSISAASISSLFISPGSKVSPATAEHDELPLNIPFILLQGQPGGAQPGNGTAAFLGTFMHNSFGLSTGCGMTEGLPRHGAVPGQLVWSHALLLQPSWHAMGAPLSCLPGLMLQLSPVFRLQARLTPATGTGPLLP